MKKIKIILFSVIISMTLTGCIGELIIMGAGYFDRRDPNWANKAHLEKLMNHPEKQLLTEDEKIRAAEAICDLNHLNKRQKNQGLQEYAKKFCKLKENDKIYFYDWCMDCGGGEYVATSYLLVRDDKPFESAQIETRYITELKKSIPIIERLH